MFASVPVILLTAACFLAAVLNLAARNRFRNTLIRYATLIAACTGCILYGYGYTFLYGFRPIAILRALFALCKMFAGVNDLSSIERAPLFQKPIILAVFWISHFLAFYATASTAIATLGEQLLRRIRIFLLRHGPLLLIFGVNSDSVAYGRQMAQESHRSVLFVARSCDPAFHESIRSFGAVLEQGSDAIAAAPSFLRRIGMAKGNRYLELAALDEDSQLNMEYARAFLASLSSNGIQPGQTGLLISCRGEEPYSLQASEGSYGYGSVFAFDSYSLTARLFMKEVPPCSCIRFRPDGTAAENYHLVLAGFGRMGRAFLEYAIMNGQFAGSCFRADIFDPRPQNGFLHDHILLSQYDIRFHRFDVTSEEFYTFLEENRDSVRSIFLCTGDPGVNQETASDLIDWYRTSERLPLLVQASPGNLSWQTDIRSEPLSLSVYSSRVLDLSEMDAMAMQIHSYYSSGSKDPEDAWNHCGYFGRMSSRASADFYPAVLKACGKTEKDILSGAWPPDREVLENLAITEHLRWCAFHYVMGFRPMPEEVYEKRIKMYQQEKAETGHSSIQIGKDPVHRLHACLIPWESLDALSSKENAATGGHVDYKDTDRRTVLAVRDVLLALHRNKEKKKHT